MLRQRRCRSGRARRSARARGRAGPVHLNLPFREPLAGESARLARRPDGRAHRHASRPDPDAAPVDADRPKTRHPARCTRAAAASVRPICPPNPTSCRTSSRADPRTVVIAGADAGPDAEALAHAGGWPLIAEIVSGARFGRNLVHGYRALLRRPRAGRTRRARDRARASRRSAARSHALLSDPDVEVVAVRGPGEPLNLNGATTAARRRRRGRGRGGSRMARRVAAGVARGMPSISARPRPMPTGSRPPCPPSGSERCGRARRDPRAARSRGARRRGVARDAGRTTGSMFGSSRLVRVADAVLGGKKVPVHANRGLAGIDGTIATATGIALAQSGR